MLKKGSQAPDFEGELDDGGTFRLSDLRGKKNVVLYFYPKDFTPGCTREACMFQENYAEVEQYDAVIVGVSADAADSHRAFRAKHGLGFPLIADTNKKIAKAYDAKGFLGLIAVRVTYVIDKTGLIRSVIRHDLAIGRHMPEVLDALRTIQAAQRVTR